MKNVIILGASGNIAKQVIDILVEKDDINLTLFLRNAHRLRNNDVSKCCIIEGDVLNYDQLKEAIAGQDIVYANLAGDLEAMAKNIVKAMEETGARKIIFISSIGIYDVPVRPVLQPYRKAADVIEAADLEYTILRPTWFTSAAGTVALWALAFGRAGHFTLQYVEETRDPVRASRHAVNVLMPMVAGLIAIAVANEIVIAHPHEHASFALSLLLAGGPILFLAAQNWYLSAVLQIRSKFHLIGEVVLLLVGLVTLALPSYAALILVGVSLTALAILD